MRAPMWLPAVLAGLLAAAAPVAHGQTYSGLFRDFYLDLNPLARGYGTEDGHAVLTSALNSFSPTFVQGWTDCIDSQDGRGLVSMTEPAWTVYTWTSGDIESLPLPYQYPNGDGFVQRAKWKVETMAVSGGVLDDPLIDECTRQAFHNNSFVPFLRAADTAGMFATVTSARTIAMDGFTPQHEWTDIVGEGKLNLEFYGSESGYGPNTGANSVLSALNGPDGFYPVLSEAWRLGIEDEVEGSRVYSVVHYYTGDKTFLFGPYFTSGGQPGNLVDQTVTDRPSVITEFTYAFHARWWKPLDGDFDGELANTDAVAVGAFDDIDFTPYLLLADDGNHFTGVTEVTAGEVDPNPPPVVCALDVSVSCKRNGTDVDCNDIPAPTGPNEYCRVPVKYSYQFKNNGPADAKLVSAIRTRGGSVPEDRRYIQNLEGTVLGQGFTLNTWEVFHIDLCTASTNHTKFEVKTAVDDDGSECSKAVEYEHVIDPNLAPTPAPVPGLCDLTMSVACATPDGVECNDVPIPADISSCYVQVKLTYTVRNVGSDAAAFSKLLRTRIGASDLDFLQYFPDPFEIGVPPANNAASMTERTNINFCNPGAYLTTYVTEASSDGGTTVCTEQKEYLITVAPTEAGQNITSSAQEEDEAIESEVAISTEVGPGDLAGIATDDPDSIVVEEEGNDASTQAPTDAPMDVPSMEGESPSSASIGADFAGGIIALVAYLFYAA